MGGYVNLQSNPSMTNADGFPALTEVDGYVQVYSNNGEVDMKGFGALTTIGGYVYFYGNQLLQSISGFANLKTVGSQHHDLARTPNLKSLGGFTTLQKVTGTISVSYNANQSTLAGFATC